MIIKCASVEEAENLTQVLTSRGFARILGSRRDTKSIAVYKIHPSGRSCVRIGESSTSLVGKLPEDTVLTTKKILSEMKRQEAIRAALLGVRRSVRTA